VNRPLQPVVRGRKQFTDESFVFFKHITAELPTYDPILFWNFIKYYRDRLYRTFNIINYYIRYSLGKILFQFSINPGPHCDSNHRHGLSPLL